VDAACTAAGQAWTDATTRLTQAKDRASAALGLVNGGDAASGTQGYKDTSTGGTLVAAVEQALRDVPAFDASATPCTSSSGAAAIAERTRAIDDGATSLGNAVDALTADLEPYRAKQLCDAQSAAFNDAVTGLGVAEANAKSALDVADGAADYSATSDGASLIAALTAAMAGAQALDRAAPACTTTDQAASAGVSVRAMTDATAALEDATNALNASMVASGKVYTGENGRLDPATLCRLPFDPVQLLRCDAAAALTKLNVAYKAAWGEDIPVDLSYRTYDEQVKMRDIYGGGAAEPGKSNHGWGTAIDLPDYRQGGVGLDWNYGTPKYEWMKANAPAYGWVNPPWAQQGGKGPHEPWHFEYVG